MTPYVWMFISSYEKLRKFVIKKNTITSLIQLEYSGFAGATVPICTFTLEKGCIEGYKGGYVRLSNFVGADQQAPRALEALANPDCGWFYQVDANRFGAIPGNPIAYWVSNTVVLSFQNMPALSKYCDPRQGFATGDNNRFLRFWWEPDCKRSTYAGTRTTVNKWYPCNKGGGYRKWYGNNDYLVNWENGGEEMRAFRGSVIRNPQYYFRRGITWGTISSAVLSMRYSPDGFLFESKGSMCFPHEDSDLLCLLGLVNSTVVTPYLELLCPTLDFHEGPIGKIPTSSLPEKIKPRINQLVANCIGAAKRDWNAFETSWDYERHPLI